ncbi:TetR/AcrR family transcriptional regulator [Temperatibacter marinus]|uniref:TetR/AcrR family transcriptional regulator n=1 Tax=Temperatibacter marinus TaxID=1456591 RepID=A0AA52EDY7_9PROT|nr:TetR/AcrR family transcriptional regulator [Temperatibacter marinus]WND03707.1 TetR/AcrR family transcriptional regulator [Temperatibacter marinus]
MNVMQKDTNQNKKSYHHGNLSQSLLDKAASLLEKEGASALSIRGLAKDVGVTPAAVYHHFKNRSDLLVNIAKKGFTQLEETILKAIQDIEDPDEKIKQYGMALVRFSLDHAHLYSLMLDNEEVEEFFPYQDYMNIIKSQYAILLGINQARVSKWDFKVSAESLSFATWCAFSGLCQSLKDTRSNQMIASLMGRDDAETIDVKMAVSDLISEIYIGRLR